LVYNFSGQGLHSSNLQKCGDHTILTTSSSTEYSDGIFYFSPTYNASEDAWHATFTGDDGTDKDIMYANKTGSDPCVSSGWSFHSTPALSGDGTGWDSDSVVSGTTAYIDGEFKMVYSGGTDATLGTDYEIGIADYSGSGHRYLNW